MPNRTVPALAATLVALATAAPAYVARNGLQVFPAPGGAVVRSMGGASARDFFCAAADWGVRTRGVPRGAEVVLTRDVAPDPAFDGARTAYFAFGAEGRGTGFLVGARAGESMSAAHALLICDTEAALAD